MHLPNFIGSDPHNLPSQLKRSYLLNPELESYKFPYLFPALHQLWILRTPCPFCGSWHKTRSKSSFDNESNLKVVKKTLILRLCLFFSPSTRHDNVFWPKPSKCMQKSTFTPEHTNAGKKKLTILRFLQIAFFFRILNSPNFYQILTM